MLEVLLPYTGERYSSQARNRVIQINNYDFERAMAKLDELKTQMGEGVN